MNRSECKIDGTRPTLIDEVREVARILHEMREAQRSGRSTAAEVWRANNLHRHPFSGTRILVTVDRLMGEAYTLVTSHVRDFNHAWRIKGVTDEMLTLALQWTGVAKDGDSSPTWTTHDGRLIPIAKLEDEHLANIIKKLYRNAKDQRPRVDPDSLYPIFDWEMGHPQSIDLIDWIRKQCPIWDDLLTEIRQRIQQDPKRFRGDITLLDIVDEDEA